MRSWSGTATEPIRGGRRDDVLAVRGNIRLLRRRRRRRNIVGGLVGERVDSAGAAAGRSAVMFWWVPLAAVGYGAVVFFAGAAAHAWSERRGR